MEEVRNLTTALPAVTGYTLHAAAATAAAAAKCWDSRAAPAWQRWTLRALHRRILHSSGACISRQTASRARGLPDHMAARLFLALRGALRSKLSPKWLYEDARGARGCADEHKCTAGDPVREHGGIEGGCRLLPLCSPKSWCTGIDLPLVLLVLLLAILAGLVPKGSVFAGSTSRTVHTQKQSKLI